MEGYKQLDISKAAEGTPSEPSDQVKKIAKANVDKAAQQNKTSNFNVMLLSYHIALSQILEQNDTVIGFSCANRLKKKYYKTIGYLSRAVQHRLTVSDDDKLSDLIAVSVKKFTENMANQQTSHYNDNSQFYITHATYQKKDSLAKPLYIPVKRVLTFLLMAVFEEGSDISIKFAGDNNMFTKEFLAEFTKYIECTVELLAETPDATIDDVKKAYKEKYNR